jgi:glycosyltransferase involved in cell wall biosynthesis
MKRRVLILQDHLRGGGTERQSIRLTRALIDSGWEAELIVGYSGARLDGLARETLADNVHFCGSSNSPLNNLRARQQVHARIAERPSVVMAMGRWANCLLGLMRGTQGTRTIATIRTSRRLPYLYRRSIRLADAVLANSHWALESALHTSQRPTDSTAAVIHNGLSRPELLEIDPPEKASAKRAIGLDATDKVLLSVARMDRGKGQGDLIRMLAQPSANRRKLVLLGEGPERKGLQALAHTLGVAQQVEFVGFCEHSRAYYAAADLFLSASALDSLPNALIEAQAAALPIVAYATAGVPEIIDDARTGYLVAHGDHATMHRQVEHLLSTPAETEVMGAAARQLVIEKFDPQQQIKATIDFIEKL